MKRGLFLILLLTAVMLLGGCGAEDEKLITFSDTGIQSDLIGVSIEGTTLTIKQAGTYTITGTCKEGNIIVDAPGGKAIDLILSDLNLTCSTTAPIVIKEGSLVALTLKEKTQNIITDNHVYSETVEQGEQSADDLLATVPSAAITSKCPLLIRANGDGKLVVNGNSYNGIVSSDTLTIESGVINVTAKNHGIRGKDFVLISGGVITVKAGEDGIKSTNTERAALGYINFKGGVVNIQAGDEAVSAPSSVSFSGGTITIKSKNNGIKVGQKNADGTMKGGTINFLAGIVDITSSDDAILAEKQVKQDTALVTVNGKEYTVD
ncbi:MAG: carbohydrate-binding domain-containing protein [Lachnospiraceae bacterium]|nr:carbohydrate-binding domain-containing protein [Lachnospiraceae bacterium]